MQPSTPFYQDRYYGYCAIWILFFFTAFVMNVGIGKSIGFSIGVVLNAIDIVIALYAHVMPIVANVGVTLVLLILWYIITSLSLPARKE